MRVCPHCHVKSYDTEAEYDADHPDSRPGMHTYIGVGLDCETHDGNCPTVPGNLHNAHTAKIREMIQTDKFRRISEQRQAEVTIMFSEPHTYVPELGSYKECLNCGSLVSVKRLGNHYDFHKTVRTSGITPTYGGI